MNKKIYYLLITFVFSLFFFVRCTDDYTTFEESNKDHNHTNEKLNNLLNYLNLNSEEDLKEHLSDFIDNDFKLNIDFHKITETKNKDGIIDKVALYAENLDSSNNVFYNIVFVKKNDEIITYLVSYALDKSSTTRRFVTKVVKSNNKRQSRCGGNEFYTVEMFSCPAGHGSDCNIGGCCNGCWRLVGQGFTSPEECDNPFPFDGSGDGGGSNGGSPNYSPEYLRLNNMIFEMNVKFGYKLTQPQWDNFHNYPAILTKFHSSVMSSEYSNATYLWAIAYLYDNISAANYFNQNPQDLNILFTLGTDFFNQNPNISWDYLENWFFNGNNLNPSVMNEYLQDLKNPDIVKPTKRFKNNTKINGIYNQAKTASNFKQYLKNFEPTFSVAHLLFDIGETTQGNYAVTSVPKDYWIKITFNQNVDWNNTPKIIIADTFMHEMIHAEIFRKLLSIGSTNGNIDINKITQYLNTHNYPGLFDYYVERTVGGENWQHEAMGAHYVNIMVNFLKQLYNNKYTDVEYKTIVWMGLKGTIAWNSLSQTERTLYETTWNEKYWTWEL